MSMDSNSTYESDPWKINRMFNKKLAPIVISLSLLVLPAINVASLAEESLAIAVLLRVPPGRGIGHRRRVPRVLRAARAAVIRLVLCCQLNKQFAKFGMCY